MISTIQPSKYRLIQQRLITKSIELITKKDRFTLLIIFDMYILIALFFLL